MTRPATPAAEIELEFADGTYLFRLNLPQIAELQTTCGVKASHPTYGEVTIPAAIAEIQARVLRGRYRMRDGDVPFGVNEEAVFRIHDITETIRLALIGGGGGVVNGEAVKVDAIRAKDLVAAYVLPPVPLKVGWTLAAAILGTLIEGFTPPSKEAAAEPKKARTRTRTRTRTRASSTTPTP
jgi:hypothetical protein